MKKPIYLFRKQVLKKTNTQVTEQLLSIRIWLFYLSAGMVFGCALLLFTLFIFEVYSGNYAH